MRREWSWRSRAFRAVVYQVLAVSAVALVAWFLVSNTLENMRIRGIQSGFGFLSQPAGFAIGESPIAYDSADPYWKAFAVGLGNTLRVALTGIVLVTLLGAMIGIGRLSRNFLLRGLCTAYVETFRNLPVLIQMFMWYFVITDWFPETASALQPLPGVYLSKNGLSLPVPIWEAGHLGVFIGLLIGAVSSWAYARRAKVAFERDGATWPTLWPIIGILIAGPTLGWLLGGSPSDVDIPQFGDGNIAGGAALTPEFLAVTIGLTVYTAAFVAEAVRAGIQSVSAGQVEAAASLGLSRVQSLRLVLIPQAVRVIIPSLTNQYLNLTKNSSLAVAIGYPDLVSIANTSLNQTGRAVECIAVIMAVYLALSLATATLMNWYNARVAIRER